jgi:hypothetical protein
MRFLAALLASLSLGASGCSSSPERADRPPVETDDPLDMDAPTPEQLADSPCGNPDWSKLPSGMPSEEEEVDEKPSGEPTQP